MLSEKEIAEIEKEYSSNRVMTPYIHFPKLLATVKEQRELLMKALKFIKEQPCGGADIEKQIEEKLK